MNRFLVLCLCSLTLWACNKKPHDVKATMHELRGETMGTYYVVKYVAPDQLLQKPAVDSLLTVINSSINTYMKTSLISTLNQQETTDPITLTEDSVLIHYFIKNYQYAEDVFIRSEGAYDPTITPLVNHWGFGYVDRERARNTDPEVINALLTTVGFDKLSLRNKRPLTFQKSHPQVKLDFSSVAKGQAVDEIGALIESAEIKDYYVEIGGECRGRGAKPSGPWVVGISFPDTSARVQDIIMKCPLKNMSVASSGNYRNYYTSGGTTYGHTISPKTGFPEWNDLLSASIFAESCGYADALATACMALGSEESLAMVEQIEGVEAYLVSANEQGEIVEKFTSGARTLLNKE